jgi:hypothetical protein
MEIFQDEQIDATLLLCCFWSYWRADGLANQQYAWPILYQQRLF